jgi:hypothetical protein
MTFAGVLWLVKIAFVSNHDRDCQLKGLSCATLPAPSKKDPGATPGHLGS